MIFPNQSKKANEIISFLKIEGKKLDNIVK